MGLPIHIERFAPTRRTRSSSYCLDTHRMIIPYIRLSAPPPCCCQTRAHGIVSSMQRERGCRHCDTYMFLRMLPPPPPRKQQPSSSYPQPPYLVLKTVARSRSACRRLRGNIWGRGDTLQHAEVRHRTTWNLTYICSLGGGGAHNVLGLLEPMRSFGRDGFGALRW